MLEVAGWVVQARDRVDFMAGPGVAVREFNDCDMPLRLWLAQRRVAVDASSSLSEERRDVLVGQHRPTVAAVSGGCRALRRAAGVCPAAVGVR